MEDGHGSCKLDHVAGADRRVKGVCIAAVGWGRGAEAEASGHQEQWGAQEGFLSSDTTVQIELHIQRPAPMKLFYRLK